MLLKRTKQAAQTAAGAHCEEVKAEFTDSFEHRLGLRGGIIETSRLSNLTQECRGYGQTLARSSGQRKSARCASLSATISAACRAGFESASCERENQASIHQIQFALKYNF
jgi:hypothetical protein